jgi:hypothetical protein
MLSNRSRPIFQYRLGTLLIVVAVAAVLVWLWPRSFSLLGHAVLAAWVVSTLGFWGGAARTLVVFSRCAGSYSPSQIGRHYMAFTLAIVAGLAPTACLGVFRYVFGSGGSNVAQYAGSEGIDLWRVWYDAWVPLSYASPASVLLNLLTFFVFFRPRNDAAFFIMRVCGLGSALIATWVVMTFFPDA